MENQKVTVNPMVTVTVEFFGTARSLSGVESMGVMVPEIAEFRDLISAIADICPNLIGSILLDDLSGLNESHILNLNGERFLGQGEIRLKSNDSLLLFSSLAGG